MVHHRVSVKYHPEPNRLLDHQESRQGLSLGSFVSLPSSLKNNHKLSMEEKGSPAEVHGLGEYQN